MSAHGFDNFMVGRANEVAAAAARTFASADIVAFNPLFIQGGAGRGKTHLLRAMAREYSRRLPADRAIVLPADELVLGFVTALRKNESPEYQQWLRGAELLAIDDVQNLAGKHATQELLLQVTTAVIGAGGRVAFACDRSPYEIEGFDHRLATRFVAGLVADLNGPELELRLAILQHKAEQLPGLHIPGEVLFMLARRLPANVRILEGALARLGAYAAGRRLPIDLDFAGEVLGELLRAHQQRVTIDEIQQKVSDYYRIRKAEMTSARRSRDVARPRQVAMYFSKQLTPRSLPEIGRRFGGRDHTTVIHGIRQIEKLRCLDSDLDRDIRYLERTIVQ